MRTILAALLVAMAVFLAAGCGGSSNDTAATTDAAATETTTAAETTTSEDETTSTEETTASDTDTSVAGLSEGCQKVADLSAYEANRTESRSAPKCCTEVRAPACTRKVARRVGYMPRFRSNCE